MSKPSQVATLSWVSNAPVQINVGRDLNIYGGAATVDMPSDSVPPCSAPAAAPWSRLWLGIRLCAAAAWFFAKWSFWLAVAVVVLVPLTAAMLLSLGIWLLGRGAELLLWIERRCGGGPTQLAYLPALPRDTSRLPAGELVEAKQLLEAGATDSRDVERLITHASKGRSHVSTRA
jgi:hypothetical protein